MDVLYQESSSLKYESLGLDMPRVFEAMGYGNNVPDDKIIGIANGIMEKVSDYCEPSYGFIIYKGVLTPESLNINDTVFDTGKIIIRALKGSQYFALFTATAGKRFQKWMEHFDDEGDLLGRFIADSIGSEIAELAADKMQASVACWCTDNGLKNTNRFSPGYCGWHVSQQHKLFPLLKGNDCSITLSESGLMYPIKSVSGVIGIGENVTMKEYSCMLCDFKDCFRRKKKNAQ